MLAQRLPFTPDPLIAEAKQRMRRRRLLLALALVLSAAALAFALNPFTGWSLGRTATDSRDHSLAGLTVPPDSTEQLWRMAMRRSESAPTPASSAASLRRRVLAVVAETGATVVRLKIWHRTSPPAVDLVAATDAPAVFLRHRLWRLDKLLVGFDYFKVVDTQGRWVWEYGRDPSEEFDTGAPPALAGCAWLLAATYAPPCPAK